MATHPSILAWEIPWTEEPGGLQSLFEAEAEFNDGVGGRGRFTGMRGPRWSRGGECISTLIDQIYQKALTKSKNVSG